jgi:hypothetical protein
VVVKSTTTEYEDLLDSLDAVITKYNSQPKKEVIEDDNCLCSDECSSCSTTTFDEDVIFKNAYTSDGLFDNARIEDPSVSIEDILGYYYDFEGIKADSISKKMLNKIKACMSSKIFSKKNIKNFQKK